jgi:hypothetical protein
LIDTGASRTAISPDVVLSLRPQYVGPVSYSRADQTLVSRRSYDIRLCFEPNTGDPAWTSIVRWFEIVAVAAQPATPGIDVLIGQDLLTELVLVLDGPGGRTLLMY